MSAPPAPAALPGQPDALGALKTPVTPTVATQIASILEVQPYVIPVCITVVAGAALYLAHMYFVNEFKVKIAADRASLVQAALKAEMSPAQVDVVKTYLDTSRISIDEGSNWHLFALSQQQRAVQPQPAVVVQPAPQPAAQVAQQ